jgi:U3 small nucleolar RNA-associated protein 20
MHPSSSDRIVKLSKKKRGTHHQKNHRWESFTEKVAKLGSLDPLRKARRHDHDTEDLAATTSYFRDGLEKWCELNICEGFKRLAQDVTPMCESLPQMLYFEDKIMDLLSSHIEMKEKEYLEPLLNLLANFAHDLGTRFEKHYPRALKLIISIAGTLEDINVTEWCFTCLAFMFKYLHKLLVLDLRPTYDLMSPLLGKERQQPHIARFAAEALSFLIKKAAAPALRKQALNIIIHHTKSDLIRMGGTREYGLYHHALMTMFSEAIKISGQSIHSSGVAIVQNMFSQFEEADCLGSQSPWGDVVCGVLTSLVHHTSCDTLKDIVSAVIEYSEAVMRAFEIAPTIHNYYCLILAIRCLGVITGVRKGSRVSDWTALLKSLSQILDVFSKNADCVLTYGHDDKPWKSIVLTTTVALQYAPMEAVIPLTSRFMNALVDDPLATWFLLFSSYFAQTSTERFRNIVLPYFQRFPVTLKSHLMTQLTLIC